MKRFQFHLQISPERYLDYYRGTARVVVTRSDEGRIVQFPASLLQRFVSPEGVRGCFVLTCDDNNKCIELRKLEG